MCWNLCLTNSSSRDLDEPDVLGTARELHSCRIHAFLCQFSTGTGVTLSGIDKNLETVPAALKRTLHAKMILSTAEAVPLGTSFGIGDFWFCCAWLTLSPAQRLTSQNPALLPERQRTPEDGRCTVAVLFRGAGVNLKI